jgi:hypothetical protein
MRAEMKRDVLQLDTEKVKKIRLLGSGSFADVHESLLEVLCLSCCLFYFCILVRRASGTVCCEDSQRKRPLQHV